MRDTFVATTTALLADDPRTAVVLADISAEYEEAMPSFPFTERERGTLWHCIAASLFLPQRGPIPQGF